MWSGGLQDMSKPLRVLVLGLLSSIRAHLQAHLQGFMGWKAIPSSANQFEDSGQLDPLSSLSSLPWCFPMY